MSVESERYLKLIKRRQQIELELATLNGKLNSIKERREQMLEQMRQQHGYSSLEDALNARNELKEKLDAKEKELDLKLTSIESQILEFERAN